jgi:4-amino-4-deoxy-L-arabinose transferase-like glycosyltransferase
MTSGSTSLGAGASAQDSHSTRSLPRALQGLRARPEVLAVVSVAAVLNLWGLSKNGWANTYYSAAVRSMAASWHAFLFGSLDKSGLMTVDKPPAALWVQALSVRIFGYHPLAILVPEALMGVTTAVLVYDMTRRVFGRGAGFAAGLTMALTPITVAMSRHNNPDELLILSCVAALWFATRALQDGRTRWLVLSGVCIGVGFETKMAVALFVVPSILVAYLWAAPGGRTRLRAFGQLLWGGLALAVVGLAWPILVWLTPAADRPWISGTSDNSIWSLIVNYNGVGRVAGQAGTPGAGAGGAGGGGGGGGGFSGGATGPFRLLDSALGGQAGWLIGFALVAGIGILVATRLKRADARTGWVLAIGGALLVTAVVFSAASGIFHPYYVSFLAPWIALLVGAGVGEALSGRRSGRVIGALAVVGGAITELVVLGGVDGSVSWARPLVIVVAVVAALGLSIGLSARARAAVVAVALAGLLAAPATWAADTLGHATSGTFPAGGPSSQSFGGGFGGPGGGFAGARGHGRFSFGSGSRGSFGPPSGAGGFAPGGSVAPGGSAASSSGATGGGGTFSGGGFGGGNSSSLTAASNYAKSHGGGTVGVGSQGSAASAIIASDANVAGLGGFSGRESTVSVKWLAMEVKDGKLRWLLDESNTTAGFGGGATSGGATSGGATSGGGIGSLFGGRGGASTGANPFESGSRSGGPGGGSTDNRDGSEKAIAIAEKVGRKVTFTSSSGTKVTMYDLSGKAAAILAAASSSSGSSSTSTTTT